MSVPPDLHGIQSVDWLLRHWDGVAAKVPIRGVHLAKFAEALLEIAARSIELAPIEHEPAAYEAAAVVRDLKPVHRSAPPTPPEEVLS